MSTGTVSAYDHAFADGWTFEAVDDAEAAGRALSARVQVHDRRDAEVLAAAWAQFRKVATVGPNVRLGLQARAVNRGDPSAVLLQGDCAIRGTLRAENGGRIVVGRFCYLGDGVVISAMNAVEIGDETLLAHGVMVFDNNTHPVSGHQRAIQFRRMLGDKSVSAPMTIASEPVRIGRRCWIGMNTLVMKGVEIGDETIVAAGSVVTASLPPAVVAGGNPARVLRELTEEERA